MPYLVNGDDVGQNGVGTGPDVALNIPNSGDDGSVEVVTQQPVNKMRVLWGEVRYRDECERCGVTVIRTLKGEGLR